MGSTFQKIMLKELFVINRSVLQFHYSRDRSTSDDDKAVLSSGFLSAIQDFSTHARADVLDSFSTENEYFLYLRIPDTEEVLVGVFARKAPETFAREAMEKIKQIFTSVPRPEIEGMQIEPDIKEEIRLKIDRINVQLFSDEQLSSIVIEILEERGDIPLAFLVDSTSNAIIAKFSRPRPLFKESQVREFLLIHSTLIKTLESLNIQNPYSFLTIESEDYAVVACNGGRLLSVAGGAMRTPVDDVYDAATSICYADTFDPSISQATADKVLGTITLQEDGRIIESHGIAIPQKAQIFISSLVKNVDSTFRLMTRRPFSRFYTKTTGEHPYSITFKKNKNVIHFELHQFD
ncbi:hypothetical protein EU528_06420 [Candidatus Thorarchaeota archaeon]|nr:MAG: hypothetical protein EU528_06420 [Candidatus Thorarchaeota archaeon]